MGTASRKNIRSCFTVGGRDGEQRPDCVASSKKAINEGAALPLEAALAVEREAYLQTLQTEDRLEGLASFKEKRPPVYKGK